MIADTTPDAARMRTAIYQRMSPAYRCELAARMSAEARSIAIAGIRQRHPGYGDDEVRSALFRLLLGDELYRHVWPHGLFVEP